MIVLQLSCVCARLSLLNEATDLSGILEMEKGNCLLSKRTSLAIFTYHTALFSVFLNKMNWHSECNKSRVKCSLWVS